MWNRFSASGLSIMEDRFLTTHIVIESRVRSAVHALALTHSHGMIAAEIVC